MTSRRLVPGILAIAGMGLAGLPAATAAPVLEEVVVTATMKAESLQDVPVSVNAVGGEKLFEAGIDKIEDLQAYVPNLTMSETGIGTNIYIRGIGSGINQGFEQSVGMYFDGVSYGRAQLSRTPFLDLARVEVLRGPQNILQGKNSIAGALNLISQRPSQEVEGMMSLTYEPEHGEQVIDGMYSGPLTDNVEMRVAARIKRFGGYLSNETPELNGDGSQNPGGSKKGDEPDREEETLRVILDWTVGNSTDQWLKIERSEFAVDGRQIEIVQDRPSVRPATPGATQDDFNGRRYSEFLDRTELRLAGVPFAVIDVDEDSSVLNITQDGKRSSNGDSSDNEVNALIFNSSTDLDGHQLTFVGAYLEYEYEETCDCDFTGGRVFLLDSAEEYNQTSFEFRWQSPFGETVEYIGGFYFQTSELSFQDMLYIKDVPGESEVLEQLINVLDAAGNVDGDGQPLNGGNVIPDLSTPRDFTTDADLYAAFLQGTFYVSETLRATLGARFTYEEKSGSRVLDYASFSTGERIPEGRVDNVTGNVFLAERHNLSGSINDSFFSPLLTVQWDVNDEIMAYLTLTQGFKAGGYDARSNASPDLNDNVAGVDVPAGSFEFDREVATSLEIGAKNTFMDGRLELNLAFFVTEYTDLQVSIFDGTLGFNVGNAGEARTMGLELDGRFALSETIMMTYALALLDFEFTDYEKGQCYMDRVNAGRGWGDPMAPPPDQNPDGSTGAPFCDYTGDTNQYAADVSGNVTFSYADMVSDALELRANLDFVFTTDYNPSQNLDPSIEQDGYVKVNGRLALANLDDGWEIALIGKNLTDEETISYANDVPLANSSLGSVGHYAFVDRPLSIGLQFSKRWY